jgi:hypothetical protein
MLDGLWYKVTMKQTTTPLKLTKVTLRAGTKYQAVRLAEPGSMLDPEQVLGADIEVTVGDLGKIFNVYETVTGHTIFVRVENEVR